MREKQGRLKNLQKKSLEISKNLVTLQYINMETNKHTNDMKKEVYITKVSFTEGIKSFTWKGVEYPVISVQFKIGENGDLLGAEFADELLEKVLIEEEENQADALKLLDLLSVLAVDFIPHYLFNGDYTEKQIAEFIKLNFFD